MLLAVAYGALASYAPHLRLSRLLGADSDPRGYCCLLEGTSLSLSCNAGTIVNAPLGKKYLLTADHCFIGGRLSSSVPSSCMEALVFQTPILVLMLST